MSEPTKKGLVPVLRFPEFRDTGEWGKKNLGELAIFLKGKGLPKSAITRNGKNLCVHYGELFTEYSEVIANINSRTDLYDGCFFSVENDVLMPTSDVTPNGLAKACCIKFDGVILGGDILVIRTDKTVINGEFISRQIRHLEQKVLQLVSGSTVFHLYASSIEKLVLLIPSFKEQQKIADCLSSIDELVTAQTQKIEALKAHKKGLMQQLFPAEGETVPKLRFPEFRDAGEWEEKLFESVATFSKGKGISKSDISPNGVQPCIRYGELYTYYSETIESVVSYTNISSDDLVLSKANDVIIPASGETQIDIATASCVLKSGIALGGDLNIIRSKMNGVFLSYYLNNAKKKDIAQLAQGISVVHLYSSQLKNLNLNIPKISEQQKIADCLSSIDDLITTQTQKLAALKTHKKGLMQQLFPAVDMVAG